MKEDLIETNMWLIILVRSKARLRRVWNCIIRLKLFLSILILVVFYTKNSRAS